MPLLPSPPRHFPTTNRPNIFISQDGSVASVTQVITQFIAAATTKFPDVTVTHLRHQQVRDRVACTPTGLCRCCCNICAPTQDHQRGDDRLGYMPLARHFGWALGQVFDVAKAPRVIVLEVHTKQSRTGLLSSSGSLSYPHITPACTHRMTWRSLSTFSTTLQQWRPY